MLEAAERESLLAAAVRYYGDGAFAECEGVLRALIALAPDDPRPWQLLGSSQLLNNRRTKARASYERARALAPGDPYTLVALAEIYLDDLEIREAVAVLEDLFALEGVA